MTRGLSSEMKKGWNREEKLNLGGLAHCMVCISGVKDQEHRRQMWEEFIHKKTKISLNTVK